MANFNEHALEMSIMELFKDEGYTYVSGDQIHRERTEVLLTDDLKQYLYNRYAKDGITPSEVDSVILMLRNISGTIYEANKAVFKLLCDGFILNREDRTHKDLYIELIDFDTPGNNIFKVVNQFEIEGVNNQLRIPDGIVFVNGIPVVVLEFKSAVQENTTISLAIHMNREANKGVSYNPQKDLLPLLGCGDSRPELLNIIAEELKVSTEDILAHDLFLYNRTEGTIWGADREFVSAPRLDDLQCAFASMEGMLAGKHEESIAVHCVLDNEEVGSGTKQGAASTFLKDTLRRINDGLGRTYEEYLMTLAGSFMISADNAHALHPNYIEKADPVNRPLPNGGIVIKYNANQKYCTDAVSAAKFKDLCDRAGVKYQTFVNRSDVPGGSTLGNISNTQVPMNTVDIGLPQLAMHSPYETAGVEDTGSFIRAAEEFFI